MTLEAIGAADPPLHPDPAAPTLEHAEHLLSTRRVSEALHAFQHPSLIAQHPGSCSAGRWQCQMLLGNLASAWSENDALRASSIPDPHRLWNGEPMAGKRIIVRCLHGFGDAIQFLRYAPELARLASHLILEVAPALIPLAPFLRGPHEIITWGPEAPSTPPRCDVQIELMELPYLFRSTLDSLPPADACLDLAALDVPRTPRIAGRPRIGLAWGCGEWNPSRSIPFELLSPVLALASELSLFSLHPSSTSSEWNAATSRLAIRPADTSLDNLLSLTRFIAGLDLVITVDTLSAHLAGALGRPAWVLLQHQADWRWLLDRDDSPWYPSLRLLRQPAPGDWSSLVQRVSRDLLHHPFHAEIDHAPLG